MKDFEQKMPLTYLFFYGVSFYFTRKGLNPHPRVPRTLPDVTRARDIYMIRKGKKTKMAAVNLSKMSLKDLLALQEDLEQAIVNAQLREKQEVLSQMEALAQERGFSMNELVGPKGRGKGKGSVSAAKYANPDNRSETWTGRGRKPNWLVAKLKKGSKIEDFAI